MTDADDTMVEDKAKARIAQLEAIAHARGITTEQLADEMVRDCLAKHAEHVPDLEVDDDAPATDANDEQRRRRRRVPRPR